MDNPAERAIAIVGIGAILPDASNPAAFWRNIINKRYSISEVPSERWCIADYYDPDPKAPDKTYSKIGGWVRGFNFDWKRFRMPPKVAAAMDEGQQWAVTIAADALADYGYPQRPLNTERTAVILGTAMGGELHYVTHLRVAFPEFAHALESVGEFSQLPAGVRQTILNRWHDSIDAAFPSITEDSMPGELPNIVSGRVANVLNLRGPNFITDAACASSFAAIEASLEMLVEHKVDAVISGGVDRNMGVSSFVKFCKIGALSATGTRPFGEGADGFVMGEGAAAFLLKRLEDAERDGDKIYAVIRGVGGASDGKGKSITAPNPIGQQLAMQRAWENAGLDPATATLIEAHGTSTKVGDIVEVESLAKVFKDAPRQRISLGSVKSNIGHLKAGAGAAGLLKATHALHHKILPPTLNAISPNPSIDFDQTPFYLNHEAREWTLANGTPRRCGVSAYGFGGTNFHVVLEEYGPGLLSQKFHSFGEALVKEQGSRGAGEQGRKAALSPTQATAGCPPLRGILALGANTAVALLEKLDETLQRVQSGWMPALALPEAADIQAPERLVIDFGSQEELLDRLRKAQKVMDLDSAPAWKAVQAQGIFRGNGNRPGKIAFLFPGQGSQYVNMGRELAQVSAVVAEVFAEADKVMTPILGRPLTEYIFVDPDDKEAVQQAQFDLMQTAITQPAMLTLDIAIYRLLESYGFRPDMVMGHSLGEYAALIVAGIMPFADALEAAAARGSEMTRVSVDDNGRMAAVLAPYEVVEATLNETDGYVVPANINSPSQCVIGGASKAVEQAVQLFEAKGYKAVPLPVSHAFHTRIVAPASVPLRQVLDRLTIRPPQLSLVANVTGDFYPSDVEAIKDILQQQIAAPVQWVKGLERLYNAGARTFVEVGPKRALHGFASDVFSNNPDVTVLLTNHPKSGELPTFNQALCGLYAAGHGEEIGDWRLEIESSVTVSPALTLSPSTLPEVNKMKADTTTTANGAQTAVSIETVEHLLNQVFQRSNLQSPISNLYDRNAPPAGSIVISGTGLGLPGAEKAVMDPENARRILRGEQFIDLIPERFRKQMVAKRITRLVKTASGNGSFEAISDADAVIKLAGRAGSFDLAKEYGVSEKLIEALDITTQLAMAAGLDALREAGIPLVQTYRRTTTGSYLPDRWLLPEALHDETGVIFASAFPGGDRFAEDFKRYYSHQNRREQLEMLEDLRGATTDPETLKEIQRRISELRNALAREPYTLDRRFIFRILAMGHSQFAEYIGARGPNTQVNAACASTTQAIAMAEDWIRDGRCRRVIVIAADNVTGDNLMEWVGAGFLAVGAAATDDRVEEAALPFDRRRHGAILGMGACALVVESEDVVRQRGMRGIVEVLSTETRNSAFHGSRLDVDHIATVMNDLVTAAERRYGLNRYAMAPQLVFMSHETYTPARGGSASAEVAALRHTFGEATDDIIVANTKGFTGHPMGVGVEDVIALKILEYGIVPPVPNYKEVDDELGILNLSRGGRYPVQYALHLAAGFGSQIALTLIRRIPGGLNRIHNRPLYQRWMDDISGYDRAETEVEKRVLRIKAQGVPTRSPAANTWQYGTGPVLRTQVSNGAAAVAPQPARMNIPEGRLVTEPALEPGPVIAAPQSKSAPMPEPVAVVAEVVTEPVVVTALQPPTTDPAVEKVLAIVAAQTGYPTEMLDLDLDLEADLGVDTVKQAETFMAIRQAFDIPRQDNLQLRDYPTLAKVIEFVQQMRPDLAAAQLAVGSTQSAEGSEQYATEGYPVGSEQPAVIETAVAEPSPITEKVLAIVAEQTGYPTEMLELDLDLEADLGVDTVKQAETFAAIRQAFDIPRLDNLQLRDYPTLGHVIGFVEEMRPDLAGEQLAVGSKQLVAAETPVSEALLITDDRLLVTERVPRRVPVPSLRPSLDLCKPTGVTLDENRRVVVMMDSGGVGKTLASRLEKLGVMVLAVEASLAAEELEAQLETWLADGPIHGVYWLPALDVEPNLEEMTLASWRELNRQRVKNLYVTMRALYDVIREPGTFLLAATRLGGLHGYGPEAAVAPLGGAVTGFTKAYKREHPGVLVKAVDFEASRKTAQPDDALIAETLADPGVVEVGCWQNQRYAVTLVEQPAGRNEDLQLDGNTVFLVTGAAGGITSAIVADLAAASSGTFYLLDLAPAPEPTDARVSLFRQSRDALKQQLIEEAKAAGERPTPVAIEKQLMAVERQEAALRAVESVEAAGGTACYRSVDLLDGQAVAAIIDEIRQQHGRIDVLIHAAGLEISRTLPDKDPAQFDLVFDVKADGFFNLLRAAKGIPIGATVAFSSVAGRFGNSGQSDYSAANDLLCKVSSSLRRWRPETRGIVIDWTAWADIGMATRGSIPKIMEMAGIEMLPPEVGVPTVRRELIAGGQGEIVVAGALGVLTEECDANGGLDVDKANAWLAAHKPQWLMIGRVKAARLYGGLEVETTLDPRIQPFLYDHAMDGTPLLPGVMGTEAFAELASALAPGYAVAAVTNEQFQAPFKFYRMEPQTLYLSAMATPVNNGDLLVHTVLKSVRKLAQPGLSDQEKVHFTADVHLTCAPVAPPAQIGDAPFLAEGERVSAEAIYRIYFHGPAYQVLEWVQIDGDNALGLMAENLPPNTDPADAASLIAPRLVELCFQTAGIWEMKNRGVLALPLAIQSVTAYQQAEAVDGKRLYARVEAANGGQHFNAQVVDEVGNVYVTLSGYRTVQVPGIIEIGG